MNSKGQDFNKELEDIDKDFVQSEDIIFLIETTQEYFNSDWEPTRAYNILTQFNNLITSRMEIDNKDRYLLVFYNRKEVFTPKKELTNNPQELLQFFSQVNPDESIAPPKLSEAISLAAQTHLATLRRVGNKTLRIIILTHTGDSSSPKKIEEIAQKILKNLEIVVDVIKLDVGITIDPIKNLPKITEGTIYMAKDTVDFAEKFMDITKKKKVLLRKYSSGYVYSDEQIMGKKPLINQFLEKIASDLVNIDPNLPQSDKKCQICFKEDCTHQDLNHTKACPNCGKTMHLCCVGSWSSQMKFNNPYVFRCPFCFFLLRVPHEFIDENKVKEILSKKKQEILAIQEKSKKRMRKEEALKSQLLEFQVQKESMKDPNTIFEDWIEDTMPYLNPQEKLNLVKEFSMITDNDQRNEFVNFVRFSKNIQEESYPEF